MNRVPVDPMRFRRGHEAEELDLIARARALLGDIPPVAQAAEHPNDPAALNRLAAAVLDHRYGEDGS